MAGLTVAEMARLLRGSGLLSPGRHAGLRALQAGSPRPKALLRAVLDRGWLTPYQARELFSGRGGELLLGDWVVLEQLGQGGAGRVFKARHREGGPPVAIKVCRAGPGPAGAAGSLAREGRAGAGVEHPNLLRTLGAGRAGDARFLVLEYAEGSDLARLVRGNGPLPVGRACDYARQAALGLDHLHGRGLVHRDVKPSNLLLTAEGAVKVLDLGLALPAAKAGQAATAGTPDYMAPEQARGPAAADARSDVYGLGCTLYFLLAGSPPFPGGTPQQKLRSHLREEPADLAQLRPEVPQRLSRVVRRMMARQPARRYPTAAAAAEALAPFAEPGGCDQVVLEVEEGLACLDPAQATVVLPARARG
jgi:serine/threonine-protein kinase